MKLSRLLAGLLTLLTLPTFAAEAGRALDTLNPLELPRVGDYGLRVIAPDVLELTIITTKKMDAPAERWNFIGEKFAPNLPAPAGFAVEANGKAVAVAEVGFKRRPTYAPLKQRDLRIGNWLYLRLAAPLPEGASVVVKNPDGSLWKEEKFEAKADPRRTSPAIHVNQVGYLPVAPKKVPVGFYLGSLGELAVAENTAFDLVDAVSGASAFTGKLRPRPDQGWAYKATPYQRVMEADFTAFSKPGDYRLVVPGLGASLPFRVGEEVAACFARAYALGLYHQRCGMANELPFTRFVHVPCHTTPAMIPENDNAFVNKAIEGTTGEGKENPRHTAPRMKGLAAALYPFVKKGTVDTRGGHHDAGDYSKYTVNVAHLIHSLVLAADVFPGAAELDNLGLPESGDGKSDLYQEAKWEADFLAKLQDDDGGFFFLVYPQTRKYEGDVLPDDGDPQLVYPKNTAATAAAVGALAQTGSSPGFREAFPEDAKRYLAAAKKGWAFLEAAWAKHGRDGAYQKITHYGDVCMDDDEIAWAATEMFLATGEEHFHQVLLKEFDPTDPKTKKWGWVRLDEEYGAAAEAYAFAEKTGRLPATKLNKEHLEKCRSELVARAKDELDWARQSAYGTSFPEPSKRHRKAGWYFPVDDAFHAAVADQIAPSPDWMETAIGNLNYEAGGNPNNVVFLTGLGWKRQREIVHNYAQSDRRVLPPSGIPLGSVQGGFAYLENYKKELGALTFPFDGDESSPYPFYDRWGDSFNTKTEFTVGQQGRGLAAMAWLMGPTKLKAQPWRSTLARIEGVPTRTMVGQSFEVSFAVEGLDPAQALVVWEGRDHEPFFGAKRTFIPTRAGPFWVEVEAQWPDGRRAFAAREFSVAPRDGAKAAARGPATLLLESFDGHGGATWSPSAASMVKGKPMASPDNIAWMKEFSGQALHLTSFDDEIRFPIEKAGSLNGPWTLSAWIYVEKWGWGKITDTLLGVTTADGKFVTGLRFDKWAKPTAPQLVAAEEQLARPSDLAPAFRIGEWQFVEIESGDAVILRVDGKEVVRGTPKEPRKLIPPKDAPLFVAVGHWLGWADDLHLRSGTGK